MIAATAEAVASVVAIAFLMALGYASREEEDTESSRSDKSDKSDSLL